MLIAMQKPDATLVAGFNSWKNKFERSVNKGEKGIQIFAPAPYKIKKEQTKLDPDTDLPVLGKDGKPIKEEIEVTAEVVEEPTAESVAEAVEAVKAEEAAKAAEEAKKEETTTQE